MGVISTRARPQAVGRQIRTAGLSDLGLCLRRLENPWTRSGSSFGRLSLSGGRHYRGAGGRILEKVPPSNR